MKKILSFLLLVIFISCGKDGSMGPQGEQGVQGIRGEKGEDGSTIYSGAVVPLANLGSVGDFYFRTGTSDFYGPKTDAGWGTPTNLKGAMGATGATGPAGVAGSKILSGTAVPAANTGANGDFYFRTSTADFYGPKSSSGWGTPINLKGVKGEDGSRIYSGTSVPATSLGNDGDFYFRTSTSDFYGPKTGTGWGTPTNLKGATGAPGATGATGPAGAAGSKILSGTAVPSVSVGINGDFYLRTTTADLYGPKTSSGWGTPINLRGTQGPAGPQGPPGTANVIYSDWINPTDATWSLLNTPRRKLMDIYNSQIDLDIVNKGIVLVYYRTDNGWITQLPYNIMLSNGTVAVNISSIYGLSSLVIEMRGYTRDILDSEYLYNSGAGFRYVIIPGGILATTMSSNRNTERSVEIKGKIYTKSDLEKMSYNEVHKLVEIPE